MPTPAPAAYAVVLQAGTRVDTPVCVWRSRTLAGLRVNYKGYPPNGFSSAAVTGATGHPHRIGICRVIVGVESL
jgi:hypothetical protein